MQNLSRPLVAITGASGFIGKRLCLHFLSQGYPVLALSRAKVSFPGTTKNFEWKSYSLTEGLLHTVNLKGAVLIHAAYSTRETKTSALERINLEGSQKLFQQAQSQGVAKIVFISSMAAHAEAVSFYGRCKLQLEQSLGATDVALRPGLVLGNGGLFLRLKQAIEKSRVMPLFFGGKQSVQVVWVEDLCKAVQVVIENSITGRVFVAHPKPVLLRDLYQRLAAMKSRTLIFLPFPGTVFLYLLRVLEIASRLFRIPLPITGENLLGLKKMKTFEVRPDLAKLDLQPLSLEQILQKLGSEPQT